MASSITHFFSIFFLCSFLLSSFIHWNNLIIQFAVKSFIRVVYLYLSYERHFLFLFSLSFAFRFYIHSTPLPKIISSIQWCIFHNIFFFPPSIYWKIFESNNWIYGIERTLKFPLPNIKGKKKKIHHGVLFHFGSNKRPF